MAGVFEGMGNTLDGLMQDFSTSSADFLIGTLLTPIELCIAIYFMAKAYLMMQGRGSGLIEDLVISGARIAFIVGIALSTPWYTSHVIDVLNSFQGWMTEVISQSSQMERIDNHWAALDKYWETVTQAFTDIWSLIQRFGLFDADMILAVIVMALVTGIAGISFTMSAIGIFLINKVGLILVLSFGPLFLCCLMFPITRSWFDSWLKTTLTLIFTIVIATGTMMIFSNILTTFAQDVTAHAAGAKELTTVWVPVLVYTVLSLASTTLMAQAPSLAASLTGGVSLAAVGMNQMIREAAVTAATVAGGAAMGYGSATGNRALYQTGKDIMPLGGNTTVSGMAGRAAGSASGTTTKTLSRSQQLFMEAVERMSKEDSSSKD